MHTHLYTRFCSTKMHTVNRFTGFFMIMWFNHSKMVGGEKRNIKTGNPIKKLFRFAKSVLRLRKLFWIIFFSHFLLASCTVTLCLSLSIKHSSFVASKTHQTHINICIYFILVSFFFVGLYLNFSHCLQLHHLMFSFGHSFSHWFVLLSTLLFFLTYEIHLLWSQHTSIFTMNISRHFIVWFVNVHRKKTNKKR